MTGRHRVLTGLWMAVFVACGGDSEAAPGTMTGPETQAMGFTLDTVTRGMNQPVFLTGAPGDTTRIFVVERPGRIRIIRNKQVDPEPFLDVTALTSTEGERGLLSFAFHPNYTANGRFFIYYTDVPGGDTRIVRYHVSSDPDRADPQSATLILTVSQPFSNHNGGQIAFGPDGMFYIGLGDGGGADDQLGSGQDLTSLLGTILRLDVDNGSPFAIPAGNPFVGNANARDEIWASGLRNPWRFSFDRLTGDLYIADVGQDEVEEIDVQPGSSPGGENYGWNTMEGGRCFQAASCDQTGLTLPIFEYFHDSAGGCSITGGYVYRGKNIPSLAGRYLYADFCSAFVRSFAFTGGAAQGGADNTGDIGPGGGIVSFGEDTSGELYILTIEGGVFKIVPRM